jgi:hypothetical protein
MILRPTGILDVERHQTRHALDGQLAGQAESIVAGRLDAARRKRQRGTLRDRRLSH